MPPLCSFAYLFMFFLSIKTKMKKSVFVWLCAVLMSVSAYAQSVTAAQVPSPVKKAMMTKYPKSNDIEWEKAGNTYIAMFSAGDDWTVATFTDKGVWAKTDVSIDPETLPAAVKTAISKLFEGYEATSANKIETPSGTTYLAQVVGEDARYEVIFKADGSVVKKTKQEEEEYEDSESYDDDNDY